MAVNSVRGELKAASKKRSPVALPAVTQCSDPHPGSAL